ncbi:MAG: bifunctional alpha,alpha-trehalose-phosphate synthase (UDP-forming)/trehalose-phosphatase [Psychroflexus sp.]|nr:bifunctional alpha,alpha-trehalose-phosphate synthase (UDP-forming)/trehalose-phosphatase [Psychroflexus sp.]
MSKTIIVSNRLPLQISREGSEIEVKSSVGGLATGMKSIHQEGNGIWVGWSGLTDEEIDKSIEDKVDQEIKKAKCEQVRLNEEDIKKYYLGFSNRVLWPLFHYFLEFTEFDNYSWQIYERVNQKFADVVIDQIDDGDMVWVHDYQLLLLPGMIKEAKPNTTIGFFLHIPFPSFEIFRTFPKRREILNGMLGADLLGFHTYDYERHFLSSVKRILRKDVHFNKITYGDRLIKVDSFPMGIDYDKFYNTAKEHQLKKEKDKSELQRRLDSHLKTKEGVKMILSIDRLDYTKGIPNRIRAFEYFLEKYPEYIEKIRLIMLAVPSRSSVPQYKKLKRETDELVGRVNGKFSTVSWTPIWYFYRTMPFDNLIDLYTSSEVAFITPVRDGMNLVAKEYVATRTKQDGVLILSEMAGAANEMNEALLINPYNFEQMADALKQAIEMPKEEQKHRIKLLQKRLSRYNVEKWGKEFMKALVDTKNIAKVTQAKRLNDAIIEQMIDKIKSSKRTLMLLDYDGTLICFKDKPQDAAPDDALKKLLDSLQEIKNLDIGIVSGRSKDDLNKWFGDKSYHLISDHGVWVKMADQDWEMTEHLNTDWISDIHPVLETFVDRTPGTFIEQKNYSLAWHYRNADPEMAKQRVMELNTVLTSFISNTDLSVIEGNKVLQIKSNKVNKGRSGNYLLNKLDYDQTFGIGDDWTDEFMFEELPDNSFTIKVGIRKTKAKFFVKNQQQVRQLLMRFADELKT